MANNQGEELRQLLAAVERGDMTPDEFAAAQTRLNLITIQIEQTLETVPVMLEAIQLPAQPEEHRLLVLYDLAAIACSLAADNASTELWPTLVTAFSEYGIDLDDWGTQYDSETWRDFRLSPTPVLDALTALARPQGAERFPLLYAQTLLNFAYAVVYQDRFFDLQDSRSLSELKHMLEKHLHPDGSPVAELEGMSESWEIQEPEGGYERRTPNAFIEEQRPEVFKRFRPTSSSIATSDKHPTAPAKTDEIPNPTGTYEAELQSLENARRAGKLHTSDYHHRLIMLNKRFGRTPDLHLDQLRRTPPVTSHGSGFRPLRWIAVILLMIGLPLAGLYEGLINNGSPWFFAFALAADALIIYAWLYKQDPKAADAFALGVTAVWAAKKYKDASRKKDAAALADELERRK